MGGIMAAHARTCQMRIGLLTDALNGIGRVALAQDCALCGTATGDRLLCAGCCADLPVLGESCPRCALPTPGAVPCGRCVACPPSFDRTIAVWRYEFPCDRLVQALKYRARLPIAAFFAQSLAARRPGSVDLVVPMPLHRSRLAERGFNPSVEIARALAGRTGDLVEPAAARRVRRTAPQTELPLDERAANVRGAFACSLDLRGKRVAVVDDVMTTGTTLEELARVLKTAGASTVENWVIARTLLD
jgi:ComF family protein